MHSRRPCKSRYERGTPTKSLTVLGAPSPVRSALTACLSSFFPQSLYFTTTTTQRQRAQHRPAQPPGPVGHPLLLVSSPLQSPDPTHPLRSPPAASASWHSPARPLSARRRLYPAGRSGGAAAGTPGCRASCGQEGGHQWATVPLRITATPLAPSHCT